MSVASSSSAPTTRWLSGPAVDLALGCGGAYAVVFALLVFAGDAVRSAAPLGLMPLLVLVTGVPHYGATLLRVYEDPADRRAYRFFSVWTTIAVYGWFVAGVYDVTVGSVLVTVYLTWSPWHYSGQNYGLAVLFLRRRGVTLELAARRWLYTSFLLSYGLAFTMSHAAAYDAAYAPISVAGSTYRFIRLEIPLGLLGPLMMGLCLAYAGSLVVSIALLRREGSWRELLPTLALVGTQGLWFSLPALSRVTGFLDEIGPFDVAHAEYAFLWIAVGHSVQYLWVTTYYATTSNRAQRRGPYLLKTWLAGGAIWGIPVFAFAPGVLGTRAFDAGLALLVASVVNIHHFILDGAIWKLRDGRLARVLVRSREAAPAEAGPEKPSRMDPKRAAGRRLGLRSLVWATGVAYGVATVVGTLEFEFGVRPATERGDIARLRVSADRLRWIGRDHPDVRYNLGMQALRDGRLDEAGRELERSLALRESAIAWTGVGLVRQREHRHEEALDAYRRALDLDPENVAALSHAAMMWVRLGDRERAREALARAVELAPRRVDLRDRLEGL